MTPRTTRTAAGIGIALTTLGICYTIAAMTGWTPAWGSLAQAGIHVGELAVVIALVGAGVTAGRRAGWAGLGIAAVGQVLLVIAELVYPGSPDLGNALFAAGPLLSGVGMIVTGVVVFRARVWRGWQRPLPLVVGIWILVPATPILILTGGPPAPLALAAIVVWDVLWALTGAAVIRATAVAPAPVAAATHA